MYTDAARRALVDAGRFGADTVVDTAYLGAAGWTPDGVRAQIRARRWQRIGRAVIRHNGEPSLSELSRAALIVLGPRAALTSFTALQEWGLTSWERDSIHVLVPRGARVRRPPQLPMRVHYTDDPWPPAVNARRGLHRPACGVLAAVVQQRLVRPSELIDAVTVATRTRHRRVLLLAAQDIGQGAQALSEIDFARLCRSNGLPEPIRQAVRRGRDGRRRYLDATWRRADGRRVVAEVDGALHRVARRWWDDQLRQNELVLAGDVVLRFPSVVVRCEPRLVVDQVRRALTA